MKTQIPKTESISFYAILSAPVLCFFLGAGLLYYLDVAWQLNPSGGILSDVASGAGFALLTFSLLAGFMRLSVARSLREIAEKLLPLFRQFNAGQILILSVAAGVGEEVLFRGFLQVFLYDYIGIDPAILLTSVLFGLLHFGSASYFLMAAIMGLALGIAYHVTGSLLLVMVWHGVYDLLAFWVVSRYPEILQLEG